MLELDDIREANRLAPDEVQVLKSIAHRVEAGGLVSIAGPSAGIADDAMRVLAQLSREEGIAVVMQCRRRAPIRVGELLDDNREVRERGAA